jgi:hypothetical protein
MIRLTNEQGMALLDLIDRDPSGSLAIGEIGTLIRDQIASPTHEVDLIDTIAKALGTRGRVRSIFSDDKLELLRSAIFSPRDLIRLNSQASGCVCSNCSQPLKDEHMVGVVGENIYCTSCFTPTMTTCVHCKGSISLYEQLRKFLSKLYKDCERCVEIKANRAKDVQRADDGAAFRAFVTNTSRRATPLTTSNPTRQPVRTYSEELAERFRAPQPPSFDGPPTFLAVDGSIGSTTGASWEGTPAPAAPSGPSDDLPTSSWLDDDEEDE